MTHLIYNIMSHKLASPSSGELTASYELFQVGLYNANEYELGTTKVVKTTN